MNGTRVAAVAGLVLLSLAISAGLAAFTAGELELVGLGMAFIVPAIIALFGMFWLASNWKDAITAAFAVTYFIFIGGLLAIVVVPTLLRPEGTAAPAALPTDVVNLIGNYTALVGVVMVAYFSQEAVRAGAQAFKDSRTPAGGDGGVQIDTNATQQ